MKPGDKIGEYILKEPIGPEGGMGELWKGLHPLIGKQVVIKLLKKELAAGNNRLRFEREARTANQIGHPNVIDIFSFGVLPPPDDRPYFVMEFLQGESLRESLKKQPLASLLMIRT